MEKVRLKSLISTMLLTGILLLHSCATIFTGTTQRIKIDSNIPGAKVSINQYGTGKTTPCKIRVDRRGKKEYNGHLITLEKEGYDKVDYTLARGFNLITVLDIMCWPSIFVDIASGAMYRYNPSVFLALEETQPAPAKQLTDTKIRLSIAKPDLSRGFRLTQSENSIEVSGLVFAPNGLSSLLVNGQKAFVDNQGYFRETVNLRSGENRISIIAADSKGQIEQKEIVVNKAPVTQIQQASTTNTGEINTGKYYALIIGVNDYKDPSINDLDNPVRDAGLLYSTLSEYYTFLPENIKLLNNPTKSEVAQALENYFSTLSDNDNLLIFYAGHGYWDERFEQGYWLLSDAERSNRATWLSNSTIKDYMRAIPAKHNLLITDACFAGGIFKSRDAFTTPSAAIDQLYKLPSRKAMTSGALKEVPDKSVFVEYLIKRLKQNHETHLASEQLFSQFKIAVINNSSNGQVPQFGEVKETGDEGGDFIFIKK